MPVNIDEVINRVETLYSSHDPAVVHEQQRYLQEVQKSPQGYDLAICLLNTDSTICRYFGALTLTVVIQSHNLESKNAQILETDVLTHIRRLTSTPTTMRTNMSIVKKLMSNLSLLYLKYHGPSHNILLHFVQEFVPSVTSHEDFSIAISQNMSPTQIALALMLLSILAEDISKSGEYRSSVHSSIRNDVYPLMIKIFQYFLLLKSEARLPYDLNYQALETLVSWMSYIPNISGEERYIDIEPLTRFILLHFNDPTQCEESSSLDLIRLCFTTLNEILDINPNLLSHEEKQIFYETLLGSWGSNFIERVVFSAERESYQSEISAYVDVFLTVLQLNSIRLSRTILEPNTVKVLQMALRLTAFEGIPIMDEQISERMLLFWEELASVYQESSEVFLSLFESNPDPSFETNFELEKKRVFNEVARIYWQKIHFPDHDTYEEIRTEFSVYRTSVADFFIVAYSLLKSDFYMSMASSIIQAPSDLQSHRDIILDVESTMFLLNNINDDTVYFESQAKSLAPIALDIFQSNIIAKLESINANDPVYKLVNSTFVQFLASNEFFFKLPEGSVYLGDVFRLIFPKIMDKNSTLALLASKTAAGICEECSPYLIGFLPNLETVVIDMLKDPSIDSLVRSRMFNAYSVIAKRISDVEEHSKVVYAMLTTIAEAANTIMKAGSESHIEFSEIQYEYLSSLLSCLVNIAKGSSLTDTEIDEMSDKEQIIYRKFWQGDPHNVKGVVLALLRAFSMQNRSLSDQTIIIEKCTLILKAGLGESLGGPFVLGNDVIMQYAISVIDVTENVNAVPYIFGLIECMIGVEHRNLDTQSINFLIQRIFIDKLIFLKSDSDIIKSAVDMFSKILECKPSLIISSQIVFSTITSFAVEGILADESFIIKSISRFWTNALNLKRGTNEDHTEMQKLFLSTNLMNAVSYNLMKAFLKAPRSNLTYYYTMFRSLIAKYPIQFKQWLQAVLLNNGLGTKSETKELELFVHKLMTTRGRRTANEVLKQFWLKENGLVEYNNQKFA